MSAILEQIKAIDLNRRVVTDWVELTANYDYNLDRVPIGVIPTYKQYDITIKLGARVQVSDYQEKDLLPELVRQVKRRICDELYGEFRRPLIELEMAIAQGKQKESRDKVRAISASMFGWER